MAAGVAMRSSVTASLNLPSSPSASSPPLPRVSFFKPQLKPISVSLPTSATISLLTLFSLPHEAKALSLSKDQIVSSLTDVEKTIDQVGGVGSSVLDTAQRVFGIVSDALKPGVDAALPIAKQAGQEALKIASPVFSEASKKAQEAIESTGIDTKSVVSVAKTAVDAAQQAKPLVSSTVDTISTTDPVVIVGTAGALFLAYILFPPIWSVISFGLRGYKGDFTPAQTLDLISTSNYLLIDIRSEKDKDKAGVPRLPSSAKNKIVSIPLEELPSKLKGLIRNVKKAEAEIAALKVSYLKKINKGSSIIIMDSYTDYAKIVAKALTGLGFKNCWIMSDGFSGSKGWSQSRLGVDSYKVSFAEVLKPSRIIPAAGKRFGTTSSRLLPGAD